MSLTNEEKELKALYEWAVNERELICKKYPLNTHGLDGPASVEERKLNIEMNKRLKAILKKYEE